MGLRVAAPPARPRRVGVCLQRFGYGAAHLDELVDHAPVDFQRDRHPCRAQPVGVLHAFVHQRIALRQADPCGRDAFDIVGIDRCETPVVAVGRRAHVLAEEVGDEGLAQQRTGRQPAVRVGVLVRGKAGIEQQLQGDGQAGVARHEGASRCQSASGAVATERQPAAVQAQSRAVLRDVLHGIPGIVRGRREFVFGRKPVIDRHHGAATLRTQHAAQDVVRRDAADREAAAVKVDQHRQQCRRRRIQARRHHRAVPHRDAEILDARQFGPGHLQHAGAFLVGRPGLLRRQRVQRWMAGSLHAFDHARHFGRQCAGSADGDRVSGWGSWCGQRVFLSIDCVDANRTGLTAGPSPETSARRGGRCLPSGPCATGHAGR